MNRQLKRALGYVCFCLPYLFLAASAGAQVSITGVIQTFSPKERPVKNITVTNSSPETMYVVGNVDEVLTPGVRQGPTKPSTDVLVSPKSFSIPGKGERTVRLVLKSFSEKERVFRISFSPQDRSEGEMEEIKGDLQGRKTMIRVLTGIGLLVFVEPVNARTDLSWERFPDKVTFSNSGNLHAHLTSIKICPAGDKDDGCVDSKPRRVYGGTTFEVPLEANKFLRLYIQDGSNGNPKPLVIEPFSSATPVNKS